MSERKRVFVLLFIMTISSLIVAGIAISMLYRAALKEEHARLVETAQSQARLIEAVARFDARYSRDYPGGPIAATLSQVTDAHEKYRGFGETGEFTLAKRVKNNILFLLSHRHHDLEHQKPVSFDSELAEPMRRALSGLSGTLMGSDYRGELVLAAHEPVAELGLGIVAKIDLAEVRSPFVRAGIIAISLAVLVVLAGAGLFLYISNPMIKSLEEHSQKLEKMVEALRKARDELERRVEERTSELRRLSSKILEAQEEERKRISLELHDSVAQSLSAVKFSLETKLKETGGSSAPPGTSLEDIFSRLKDCIEETRMIMTNLRPSLLDDLGILATINWHCREYQKVYSIINVEKQIDIQEDDVPEALKIVIYRIIQEACNNVAKHSQADVMRLSLRKADERIELTLDDNGTGFDVEQAVSVVQPGRGIGLASMKERTELSGGSFSIHSQTGAGTTVCAFWTL